MKHFLLLVTAIILLSAGRIIGQVGNITDFGGKPMNASRYGQDIQGSPFLSPSYQLGDIMLSKKTVSGQKLMYDMHTDELLIKNDESILIANSATIKGFVINVLDNTTSESTRYTFKNGFKNIGKYDENAFFCMYFDSEKVKVVSKKYVEKVDQAASYGATSKTTVFNNYEDFFLIENNVVTPFKKGKGLLKAIKDDGKLKKYAQINKIDISTPAGIAKIMNQYLAK